MTIPPLDLMFFLTETPQNPKHVGAVQVFELPANAPANYLRDLVAAFKQAPVVAPFNYRPHFPRLGLPVWREDSEMEMSYHVRHSALPGPGNNEQLMEVVQRLHATMLDRKRPCWTCQLIEGLEGNRFAIYNKIHHAYIDGMSGVKRMYGSLSTSPDDKKIIPSWSYEPPRRSHADKPGSTRRPADADIVRKLMDQARGLLGAYGFLSDMGLQLLKLRSSKAQIPFSASRTRMNRSVEWDSRSTAICTFELDKVKAIGEKQNCTVNEVVLAIMGAALDDYLTQHHERPQAPLVAMCPVSLRPKGDDSAKTQASAVHVQLGNPGATLLERLEQVTQSSRAAKEAVSSMSAQAMMDYGIIIFALWELLARSRLDRFVTPSYNVLISNVPGPGEEDMYLNGSRMLASYPISVFLPGVNLNTTLLSHGNSLDFGLLGDRHALPDLEQVVNLMQQNFAGLQQQALGSAAPGKASAGRKSANKPRARAKAKASPKPKTGARTRKATARRG
jgi:WS/DGAT/MGAT family acyltransferase